jgi:hypothetical protein
MKGLDVGCGARLCQHLLITETRILGSPQQRRVGWVAGQRPGSTGLMLFITEMRISCMVLNSDQMSNIILHAKQGQLYPVGFIDAVASAGLSLLILKRCVVVLVRGQPVCRCAVWSGLRANSAQMFSPLNCFPCSWPAWLSHAEVIYLWVPLVLLCGVSYMYASLSLPLFLVHFVKFSIHCSSSSFV